MMCERAGEVTAQTRSKSLQLGAIFCAYSKVRTYLLYLSKQLYNPQQSFVVYFTEYRLLHRVLCCLLHDCPPLASNLNICSTACFLFAGDVIQVSLEILLVLALYNLANVGQCLFVVIIARNLFPFLQVFLPELFSMIPVE